MSLEQQQWRGDGGQMPGAESQPTAGWPPSEIAPCFLFLVRDDSSRITGQLLRSGGAGAGS